MEEKIKIASSPYFLNNYIEILSSILRRIVKVPFCFVLLCCVFGRGMGTLLKAGYLCSLFWLVSGCFFFLFCLG